MLCAMPHRASHAPRLGCQADHGGHNYIHGSESIGVRTIVVAYNPVLQRQVLSCLKAVQGVEIAGSASNGRCGLKLFKETSAELVVVQFNMPDMTGPAFTRAIKIGIASDPVVIIVSLKKNPQYASLAYHARADGYLPVTGLEGFAPLVKGLIGPRLEMRNALR